MLTQREITVPVDSPVQNRWVFFALMAAVLAPLRKASFMILGGKTNKKISNKRSPADAVASVLQFSLTGSYTMSRRSQQNINPSHMCFFFYCAKLFPFCVLAILCTVPSIHAFWKENQPLILSDSMWNIRQKVDCAVRPRPKSLTRDFSSRELTS